MSDAISPDSFRLVRLSLLDRKRLWGRRSDEPDAPFLWPGMRTLLSQRLAEERSFVVAALAPDDRVAARALFTRSIVREDLWHYGYLLTHPEFRRRGLGISVMRFGLAVARARQARRSSCYVAESNFPSATLNERLGYRTLPYVRVHLADTGSAMGTFTIRPEAAEDIRRVPDAVPFLDGLGAPEGAEIVVEEFLVRQPMLPWKQSDSTLVRIERGEEIIAFARRSREVANLLLSPRIQGAHVETALRSLAGLLARKAGIRALFVFVPRIAVDAAGPFFPFPFDRVYWLDALAEAGA